MADWPYFPVFARLQGQPVLLVGGGEVALRKARLLHKAGAELRVVAHAVAPALAQLPGVIVVGRDFHAAQLAGMRLCVAATDDADVNRTVAAAAEAAGVWVNVVDDLLHSRFITPAIVDRSPLLLAISSAGAAPVLARRLREQLETQLPNSLGALAGFMGAARQRLKAALPVARRRALWERFLDSAGPEAVHRGDTAAAEQALRALESDSPVSTGEVYLVGAGPGDPDLLTFRALRLMQQADVVLYDRLVAPAILDLVRRDAERVFVGKRRHQHTVPQGEINAELVRLAHEGKRVLRLKGGDPFIFGRGGEEIEQLAAEGIPFQVVPGITAASGCAAYAGIPLTHREHAQTCIFVTGHAKADGQLSLPWDTLSRPGQTVVVYMGLSTLPALCAAFVTHGLPADWPCALVVEGTQPSQQVLTGTLSTLPATVAAADISGASLLIVGTVVRLRAQLNWRSEGA